MIDFIPNVVPGSPTPSHPAADAEGFEQALTDAVAGQPSEPRPADAASAALGNLLGLAGATDPRFSVLQARLGAGPQPDGDVSDHAVDSGDTTGVADDAEQQEFLEDPVPIERRQELALPTTSPQETREAPPPPSTSPDIDPAAPAIDLAVPLPAEASVTSPSPTTEAVFTDVVPEQGKPVPVPGVSTPEPAAHPSAAQPAPASSGEGRVAPTAIADVGPDVDEPARDPMAAGNQATDAPSPARIATPGAAARSRTNPSPAGPSPAAPSPTAPAPNPAGPMADRQPDATGRRVTDVSRRPGPQPEPPPPPTQPPTEPSLDAPDHQMQEARPADPTHVVDPALRGRAERLASRIEQWAARVEHQPPPHVLTVRTGDAGDALTIRVALESGALRISVDGGGSDDLTWLRAATEQLRARGFDVTGYGAGAQREGRPDAWDQDEAASWRPNRPRPTTRPTRHGLRL